MIKNVENKIKLKSNIVKLERGAMKNCSVGPQGH